MSKTCIKCQEPIFVTKYGNVRCEEREPNFRNYNIGRPIDEKTMRFEQELEALMTKYDFHMETESFN